MTFPSSITANNPRIINGSGNIESFSVSGSQVVLNLTNVSNGQLLRLAITAAESGAAASELTIPFAVLLGDTSGNNVVNASDVAQTKANAGAPLSTANFRSDVTANGSINSSDVGLVKAASGGGGTLPGTADARRE